MKLFSSKSLIRGDAFLASAMSTEDESLVPDITPADVIGIAAACLAHGYGKLYPQEMLFHLFGEQVGEQMVMTVDLFSRNGKGQLWEIDENGSFVKFKHPLLLNFFEEGPGKPSPLTKCVPL